MSGTILITGATSGFGQATARRFAKEGWKVIGTGRRAERLEALAQELGFAFHGAAFDVTEEDATKRHLRLCRKVSGTSIFSSTMRGLRSALHLHRRCR